VLVVSATSCRENQPETYREIEEYWKLMEEAWGQYLPDDVWRSECEKDHGRLERREVLTCEDIGWMTTKGRWQDLKTIIQYRCTRTEGGIGDKVAATSVDTRYYISSRALDAEKAASLIRGHWSIENRLRRQRGCRGAWTCASARTPRHKCRAGRGRATRRRTSM